MKEKINMVQLTNNQKKEVKAGASVIACYNPEYRPQCKCAQGTNNCLQAYRHLPYCP